jgi:glycosyltransferase involved in cell wall biosynthesis
MSMRRRLLAVAAVDHPGGAETTLLRFLNGLSARGWEVTLTTPGPGPLRDQALASGLEWRPLPLGGLRARAGTRALASWPRAAKLARGADVVYLNGGVPARVLPAVAATRTRTVLHLHDMVRRVPPFWRLADVVLAASGAVADRLVGLRAEVVYAPVDPDPPPAEPPWPPGGSAVIGFIGRLEPRKGPLDFARAAPFVHAAWPGSRLVLVGDEPYGLAPEYTQEVRAAPGVEHYAWRPNAPGLMRHLDVLVLPSYEEPFGTVLAEAMAVGTPVVATRVDGLPEVVRDGVTGRLIEPGNPAALAEAIVDVLHRREPLGEAARRDAERFHTPAYVDRVEGLLLGNAWR